MADDAEPLFVSNSVAAKFDDPQTLYAVMDRLLNEISPDALRLMGGNGAFASRILRTGFVDAVVDCAKHLRSFDMEPVSALRGTRRYPRCPTPAERSTHEQDWQDSGRAFACADVECGSDLPVEVLKGQVRAVCAVPK